MLIGWQESIQESIVGCFIISDFFKLTGASEMYETGKIIGFQEEGI